MRSSMWYGLAVFCVYSATAHADTQSETRDRTAQPSAASPSATPPSAISSAPSTPSAPSAADTAQTADWARQYVAEDPLVAQQTITLDDIAKELDDPVRRATVIDRHFARVDQATLLEKRDFLARALQSDTPSVQRQAARALAALGELESVIGQILSDLIQQDDAQLRGAAMIAFEHINFPASQWPEEHWQALLEGLGSDNLDVVRSAATRLESQGASAVPVLLSALRDAEPSAQREAAKLLSRIVAGQTEAKPWSKSAAPAAPRTPLDAQSTEVKAKSATAADLVHFARKLDVDAQTLVRVYFATNREMFVPPRPLWSRIMLYPTVATLLVFGLMATWSNWRTRTTGRRLGLLLIVLFLIGVAWTAVVFRAELLERWRIGSGPRFGGRRNDDATIHYGTCDVSIPPKHEAGAIEGPWLGPEDENLHVVLQKTEEMEAAEFFDAVRAKVAQLPEDKRSCFVFIHGFNVSFENAAKRTAQIHYDLQFSGVPIFFSWPSRASLRHYFSDRNEIEYSRYMIKQFLIDVSKRVSADQIHVIAHSMGADATCRAIAELGEHGKIFDQIILAAPDIDRDVFRMQLAPRLASLANRTTMYCSKNDWALIASNTFNDTPRAGDSRESVLVLKDVDTIDASGIDTDLLGHSYYGDCLPILNDVRLLVLSHLPPDKRKLRAWPISQDLMYWTLPEFESASAAMAVEPSSASLAPP